MDLMAWYNESCVGIRTNIMASTKSYQVGSFSFKIKDDSCLIIRDVQSGLPNISAI